MVELSASAVCYSKIFTLVVVVLGIVYCSVSENLFYFVGRKSLIAIQPLVDWSVLNRKSCAVYNPWYVPPAPSSRECSSCEDLTTVPEANADDSSTFIYEHFIDASVPILIHDGVDFGKLQVHIDDILEAFNERLDANVCAFRSNTPWSFDKFLSKTPSMTSFYAMWENCNNAAKKLARRFHQRPEKLPAAVELTSYSWMALSRNFNTSLYKKLDFVGGTVACWLQLGGQMSLQLHRKKCSCSLKFVVREGDFVVVRIDQWEIEFAPNLAHADSLAVIPTGYIQ